MRGAKLIKILSILLGLNSVLSAQEGLINAFPFEENDLKLERLAQPGTPFDKVGRKFAVLGYESGSFEAWAYPLKLFRNFTFSFFLGGSTRAVEGKDIVRRVEVTPEVTTLTFTYQSFTVKAHYITPIDEAGAFILLDVASTEPLSIVCSFLPVLQPMWPAGIGGQYAYWNNDLKAYVISEPTRTNHGIVGSPTAGGLSYTPAHMLSDSPNEFRIEIDDPAKVKGRFIPIVMAGGKGKREEIVQIYQNLCADPASYYRKSAEHYRKLRERTLRIRTPERRIDLALEWAKVAYDNLVVENPDLGKGLVAGLAASGTSGRPGFGWFFGGDTYINAFSMNSYGDYETLRDVLEFTIQFQREDGKMPHEVSQAAGYIDWFGKYPYGYIHGDTSPYFVVAMYDYVRMTGDTDFVKKHWNAIRRAFEWSLATDANGDGLMDNTKAGLGALEYGKLAGGIATDVYIGAVWVKATQAMLALSEIAGKASYAKKVERHTEMAKRAFDEKFWDEESQFYAYAFNEDGEHVREFSPWNAVGLSWELGNSERSVKSIERLSSSELTTDWGVRSISNRSSYYEPLNYNYGAVWPFINSWVATAQFKHHFLLQGYCTLMATVGHVFNNQLGAVGEVFSGTLHAWPQESVAHQGFSTAGTVLPLVRGLFGLEGDALEKNVWFSPHFPADWEDVSVSDYRVGGAAFSFNVKKEQGRFKIGVSARGAEGYVLDFAPAFGIGTKIQSVLVDGEYMPFKTVESIQVVRPTFSVRVKDKPMRVEIVYRPTVEILPPFTESRVGNGNRGLKIISLRRHEDRLVLECEGLAGEMYSIRVVNPGLIQNVEGGRLEGGTVVIRFPEGEWGEFLRKTITMTTK